MSTTSAEVLKSLNGDAPKKDAAFQPTNAAPTPVATAAPVAPVTIASPANTAAAVQIAPVQQAVGVESIQDSLDKILKAQQQVSDVKKNLSTIIDVIASDKSILDRLASSFGSLPLVLKISIGAGIAVPGFAAGLLAGGTSIVAYTVTGYVLDDHHQHKTNMAERLKAGMCTLADILQLTIDALNEIRLQLKKEVDKFTRENLRLSHNVAKLEGQLDELGASIIFYKTNELALQKTKDSLSSLVESLNKSTEGQKALLEQNQKELAKVIDEYAKNQKTLAAKTAEFDKVKDSMTKELTTANGYVTTLRGVVTELSGSVVTDSNKQQAFLQKLDDFLTDKDVNFKKVSANFTDTEKELASIKEQLVANNKLYAGLIKRYEEQINRLEQNEARRLAEAKEAALQAQEKRPKVLHDKQAKALGNIGIYPGVSKTLPPALSGSVKHFEPTNSPATLVISG